MQTRDHTRNHPHDRLVLKKGSTFSVKRVLDAFLLVVVTLVICDHRLVLSSGKTDGFDRKKPKQMGMYKICRVFIRGYVGQISNRHCLFWFD